MAKEEIRDAVYTRRYIYNFHYHLIWVTKYRNKTFVTEQLSNEMKSILQVGFIDFIINIKIIFPLFIVLVIIYTGFMIYFAVFML